MKPFVSKKINVYDYGQLDQILVEIKKEVVTKNVGPFDFINSTDAKLVFGYLNFGEHNSNRHAHFSDC